MWQRALTVGGGGGVDIFTLNSDLAVNSYVDFTVKSPTYKAIGFRGNRADDGLFVSYFNTDRFTNGVFGYTNNGNISAAEFITDSSFFSFPNSTTLRFTNSKIGNGGLKAGTEICIIY
jgi:hypothetical protein